MPYLNCTFTLVMPDGSALTQGTGPVVPTKRPHALYPLDIQTSLEGGFWTHALASTLTANNTATCRISIAHSQ